MKNCADCKFLDRTRFIYWRGMFGNFYVCKKREAEQQAANNRDMTQRPIFAPSYLDTDGNQHGVMYCAEELDAETVKYSNQLPFN